MESTASTTWTEDQIMLVDCLEKIARKDREAFTVFYDATIDSIYRIAVKVLRSEEMAEEVVQEVYVHVWQDAIKYTATRGRPLAWLGTICHRRCVERVRSEESRKRREIDYFDGEETEIDVEANLMMADSLKCLNDKQKTALWLVYYEGMTAKAAAETMKVPLATVKTRLRDGVKTLRTTWKEGQYNA